MPSKRGKRLALELAESQTLPQEGEISDQEGQENKGSREETGLTSQEFEKWRLQQEFRVKELQLKAKAEAR